MKQTFRVPDVSCEHCKGSIERALQPLEGVSDAAVDLDTKTVAVDYDEQVIDVSKVVGAIEGAGYPVAS